MTSVVRSPQQADPLPMLGLLQEIVSRLSRTGPGYTAQANFDFLCQRAAEAVQAKACTLRLYDPARHCLVLRACYGLSEHYRRKPPIKPGEAIAGQVFEEGRPMAVPYINGEPRYVYRDWAVQEGARSLLSAPLLSPDGPRGTLTVYYDARHDYTEAEVQFFTLLANVLSIAVQWAEMHAQLAARYAQAVAAVAQTLEDKHPHARGHSERVGRYACMIGRDLGLGEAHLAALAAMCPLHDLQDLSDVPGLTAHLSWLGAAQAAGNGGEGPDGLAPEDLERLRRIMAVADAYDALTADRPFGPGYSPARALQELYAGAGEQFSPDVVAALARSLARAEVDRIRRGPRRLGPHSASGVAIREAKAGGR